MSRTPEQTARLEQAEHFLRTHPAEGFDLATWYERTDCGTVCCAVGAMAASGQFEGLHLVHTPRARWKPDAVPRFEEWWSWDAVERYFGLTSYDAINIFQTSGYLDDHGEERHDVKPAEVADRIRELLDD